VDECKPLPVPPLPPPPVPPVSSPIGGSGESSHARGTYPPRPRSPPAPPPPPSPSPPVLMSSSLTLNTAGAPTTVHRRKLKVKAKLESSHNILVTSA